MRCWANNLFILVVVLLGTLAMLGACGQKGDLYLPEPASASRSVRRRAPMSRLQRRWRPLDRMPGASQP
jgi:predicted small lipoprotein YifL